MSDPKGAGIKPPFPQGDPRPDHGEGTYRGHGRLSGKIALVTGADSGIGRAVALAFAREGAHVAISYLNEHRDAQETRKVVEAAQRRALLLPGDLSQDRHCADVVRNTVEAFGRIDVLVNNAAHQGTFDVDVIAMFNLVRRALVHMATGSAIINVASIQAYDPSAAILDDAAKKGAIVSFTKGLAEGVIGKGIRANAVAPGPAWTPLAPAFVFLACDESRHVNGEVLDVTSGNPLC